jgi:hypothetical protein
LDLAPAERTRALDELAHVAAGVDVPLDAVEAASLAETPDVRPRRHAESRRIFTDNFQSAILITANYRTDPSLSLNPRHTHQ